MNNFDILKLGLVKWLDKEDSKKLISKEDYLPLLLNAQAQLGWISCVLLFNSLISNFGIGKILQETSNQLLECCLVSSQLPSSLNLDYVYSSPNFVLSEERKNFTISKTSLKNLVLKEIGGSLSHMFIDSLELDTLVIEKTNIKLANILHGGSILYSIETVYLNGAYPKDGNSFPLVIDPSNYSTSFRLKTIYLGKQFDYIYKSSFSNCDKPLNIYLSCTSEVKIQKGTFNHNVNHTIYIPKGTKVICAKEDSDYFRNHMKRY